MASEEMEIDNPPFPSDACTAEQVYAHMADLAVWVDKYRPEVNKYVGRECVTSPRSLPGLTQHSQLSVPRLALVFQRLRNIRIEWDGVVRMYEREWSSPKAKNARHLLMHEVVDLLNEAYLSGEMLEAHQAEKMERSAAHSFLLEAKQTANIVKRLNREYGSDEDQQPDVES